MHAYLGHVSKVVGVLPVHKASRVHVKECMTEPSAHVGIMQFQKGSFRFLEKQACTDYIHIKMSIVKWKWHAWEQVENMHNGKVFIIICLRLALDLDNCFDIFNVVGMKADPCVLVRSWWWGDLRVSRTLGAMPGLSKPGRFQRRDQTKPSTWSPMLEVGRVANKPIM